MFKGYIYKCTCVISGKSYVGLTTKTIEERKKEHLDSHSISSCASGKYKYSGKIDSVKIVWKYI